MLSSFTRPQRIDSASQRFAARALLPAQSRNVWQIEEGFVRATTWLEDGTSVMLGIWGPGDLVSQSFSAIDPHQIECITTVEASLIPIDAVPNLAEVLLTHLHQAEMLMQIRSYRRVDVMLLRFLSWLADRYGQDVEAGRLINLRLTHLDIAEAIGSTRVTVTRVLNQLERQNIIQCLPLKRIVLREEELWHYEI